MSQKKAINHGEHNAKTTSCNLPDQQCRTRLLVSFPIVQAKTRRSHNDKKANFKNKFSRIFHMKEKRPPKKRPKSLILWRA